MIDQMLGLTMLAFALASIPFIFKTAFAKREDSIYTYFTLLCISNVCWAITQTLFYLIPNERIAIFFWNSRLVFVFTTCLFVCLFITSTIQRTISRRSQLFSLFVFPALTLIFTFSDYFFGTLFINTSISITHADGARALDAQYAVWFVLHSVFCYLLVIVSAYTIITNYKKMPVRYKKPIIILFASATIAPIGSALAIAKALPYNLDVAPYISIVGQILCYFALMGPHSVDTLVSSRDIIFENADHAMFIVNSKDQVIDFNRAAEEAAKLLRLNLSKQTPFNAWRDAWLDHSKGEIIDAEQQIITIHEETGDSHFQIIRSALFSSKKQIGTYIEIKNVTPMMTMIHMLQDSAYFDALTGLRNRNYMIQETEAWSRAEHLPLGVMMADLNNLKTVNDRDGHKEGDLLLQTAAKVFDANKPFGAVVARMGGDEFMVLVPNTTEESMQAYLQTIEEKCKLESQNNKNKLSIAAAYALRADPSSPLQDAMHAADVAMYANKNNRRRG